MNDIKELLAALAGLGEAFGKMNKNVSSILRGATRGRKKSGKTRRGAKHKQGKIFLGRKKFNGTPAQYRRQHRGIVTITPNYKQKHAAPRGRNVWTSS